MSSVKSSTMSQHGIRRFRISKAPENAKSTNALVRGQLILTRQLRSLKGYIQLFSENSFLFAKYGFFNIHY